MAGSRIIVEAPIYDAFLEKFVAKARTLKVGDPRDPHTVIGPLIRSSQCPMVDRKIKDAVAGRADDQQDGERYLRYREEISKAVRLTGSAGGARPCLELGDQVDAQRFQRRHLRPAHFCR